MNPSLQRAVTSFYNLIYEAQTFATAMARILIVAKSLRRWMLTSHHPHFSASWAR